MPATILIGAQWGDEGKGRVADWLAADSDVVARYAGGDNAGHTVAVGGKVYKLHLIPSGILHSRVTCVLGNGMVVNPIHLMREICDLQAQSVPVTPQNLQISSRAHLITPGHIALDAASEAKRGAGKIGTTLRGIGPAYMDKTGRSGIRAGQMVDAEEFAEALQAHLEATNDKLRRDGFAPIAIEAAIAESVEAAAFLRPFIRDTSLAINEWLQTGARVLCEGAQGTFLDVDHGDYPFVTSSSPTAGGALTGLGIGPLSVDRVVGVAKAYSTRVGSGPMPTELEGELADKLRGTGENFWDEFGTTTRRPRRCGWLDLVTLRYAAMVNGFTELVVTKLDILSGFETLQIATAYRLRGEVVETVPATAAALEAAQPIYESLPGWSEDLSRIRRWEDLPGSVRGYIDRVSVLVGVPIRTISVGPEREQLVHRP
ncbi:MAG: adenylosuccinate synthase [Anaerolineae bacterium]|nr:adenylosuccinate synthase [Anaerolineae bacterium]NUQ02272.1 adenylosuccinate synthase [Anaerolineae bacterium]